MADVTISQLTPGTPAGSGIVPYSTGSVTLGVPVSALFQDGCVVGIGTATPLMPNEGYAVKSGLEIYNNVTAGVKLTTQKGHSFIRFADNNVTSNLIIDADRGSTSSGSTELRLDIRQVNIMKLQTNKVTITQPLDVTGAIKATALQVPGCVTQVVQTLRTDIQTTASTTYIDATGYTITITPKSTSSKILVSVNCAAGGTAAHAVWVRLLRGSTVVANFNNYTGGPSNATYMVLPIVMEYLDATVLTDLSPVTYKLQFRSDGASSSVSIGGPLNNAYTQGTAVWTNTITCKEIAG
jgi:hypothetical protein